MIVTFLPNNCPVEELAYGRAARCGEEGSGRLVIMGKDEDSGSFSSKIFELNARDISELQRLNTVKKYYNERITIEEDFFELFKNSYEVLRKELTDESQELKSFSCIVSLINGLFG